MAACASCGFESTAQVRFCPACGAEQRAAAPSHEQRRTVTVVFCDLAGSTALGETVDPERLRALLAGYFERMQAIVEHHGGAVEKFIGDAVMAVFGVPVAHEDDALRAVRAATEMRDALPALGLAGRIGVMTGEVVTGTEERLATGDAVNVAARLEQAAAPGEVLIGEPTLAFVRGAVDIETVEPLVLKGKAEPVAAHRLLSVHDAPERRHDTRFVGRDRELALLREAWERVTAERRCELVTVLGDPGVGKSRLAVEALSAMETCVVQARCLPYGEGITYWPVVEILKQLDTRPHDEAAAAAIAALLGESDAVTSAEEIAWAFRKTLEQAAAEHPLVVVFDDIQWGEESFHDLIEHLALLSTDAPILVLCMARPELVEGRPGWPVTVRLDRLTEGDVDTLLPGELPAELRERIKRASGGNPLFVHEMLGMAGDADGEIVVPPTLQALLAARLDQLERPERSVLERGSVEGEVFHRGAVQALTSDSDGVTPRLARLVRKQLIEPDTPVLPGEDGFRFRHLLIRDAAYDALTKATRADLHQRFATWLEQHGHDLVELDEIAGYHIEQAHRYLTELGETSESLSTLATRAHERLALAGRRAGQRRDYGAAINLLERAGKLLPDGPRSPQFEVELTWARLQTGQAPERVLSGAAEAADRAARTGNRLAALGLQIDHAAYELVYRPTDEAASRLRALSEDALPLFEAAGDDWGSALACMGLSMAGEAQSRPWAEIAASAMGIVAHAQRAGSSVVVDFGESVVVHAQFHGATPVEECMRWLDEHAHLERNFHPSRARLLGMLGRFDEAHSLLDRVAHRLTELGAARQWTLFSVVQHDVAMLEGNLRTAEAAARMACETTQATGGLANYLWYCCNLARALLALGCDPEAEEWLDRGQQTAPSDEYLPRILYRSTKGQVLARRGEHLEADRLARDAVELADESDALNTQGDAYVGLADVLRLGSRRDEAVAALEQALERYERKGNLVSAGRTQERLVELRATAAP